MKHLKYSIRNKLMLVLLLCSLLPLSIAMFITYRYSVSHYKSQTTSYTQNLMYQFRCNVDTYLNTIADAIYYPYSNTTVYSILNKKSSLKYDEYLAISTFMQSIYQLSDDISSIYLDSAAKGNAYLYSRNRLSMINNNTELYDSSFIDSVESPQILPTHRSVTAGTARALGAASQEVFTIVMPLYSVPQNQYLGKLAIDVNLRTLDNLSSQMISTGEELYILDKTSQKPVTSTASSLDEENPLPLDSLGKLESQSGSFMYKEGSSMIFYETIELLNSPWLLVKSIPLSSMYRDVNQILSIYLPTYLLFLAVSILMVYRISSRFTSPIEQLTRQMKELKLGQPLEPLPLTQKDEVGVLNSTFHSMVDTINQLIVQEYELKLSNKNAQLRMLQAQLHPHFLNNSLQSLATLALKKDSPQLYSLITSLALMMNYVMDIDQTLITLDKEFTYAENYLIFQHERFGDTLHYKLDPAPDTLGLTVPKMILQPIMENYFKHGFVKRKEGYEICASSWIENNELKIQVENNGTSIPQENLKHLTFCLEHAATFDNDENAFGIGLINIQSRLNLYYKGQAKILLENKSPYGLKVLLSLTLEGGIPHESPDH